MGLAETILIIDDEPTIRMVLRAHLEDLGYQVLEAAGGAEGIELCTQACPQLVLLDINMKDLDGFSVCRILKANPLISAIPVVFLSGSLGTTDKVTGFQAGAVDYITKPFQMLELATRVKTHLQIHEQQRALAEALAVAKALNSQLIRVNERLRQSEELQSHFISNMRNEINNPIAVIMGFVDELANADLALPRRNALLTGIKSEAFILDFHFRNVLCAGELEAGETAPYLARVHVSSVLAEVAASFQPCALARGVKLMVAVEEQGCATFVTDAHHFSLAVANLLSNAITFSQPGGEVAVRARVAADALTLTVEDHGLGIEPKDREAIFTRFHQLSTGPTRTHPGQGLGLSIVKALVEGLGGTIGVTGSLGHGSLFTLMLPPGEPTHGPLGEAYDGNLFIFGEQEEK